jgi:benzoyl-CoA-dihydrodiol lyase
VKPRQFAEYIKWRALKLTEQSNRPAHAKAIALTLLLRTFDQAGHHYEYVDVQVNRDAHTATLTVRAPESVSEDAVEKIHAAGAKWWLLQMARDGSLQRSAD